jgi:pyruvate/2-oxoglutarate dehydrogenase complex dihydrolipoamide dehydrogenase (E3) component/uncharacterized membrane protein YdjX (TVP38/TMEM64 family)
VNKKKIGIGLGILALVGLFFALGLQRYLSFESIKAGQADIAALYAKSPVVVGLVFFLGYVAVASLSLPGAALLTLLAGAVFGLVGGTILVSFASSIGATIAFLAARYLLRDSIQAKFGDRLGAINRGVEKDGNFYLFTLRLIPAVPFFVVNLLMALTPMKAVPFYWVSQLGMLLGTIVYVNLGTQLATLDSLRSAFSPAVIGSVVVLALVPWVSKWVIARLQARKVYAGYQRPARFDRNIIVIGAGSAGLVTSYIAAAVKAKVTLIETHKMGGDCLNYGCVPSKALIKTARLLHQARHSEHYGIRSMQAEVDFGQVMDRVHRVIDEIEPHDSVERYSSLGVECIKGYATLKTPWEVEIALQDESGKPAGTRTMNARNIVIATGARPAVPPIPGLAQINPYTSDTIWELRVLPKRLLVLGGGPIGCELAQAFARLGSKVTQVEMAPRLMGREDPEVSQAVLASFLADGMDVRLSTKAERFEVIDGEKTLIASSEGQEHKIVFDEVLCALGRSARVQGFGLEALKVNLSAGKTVEVNEFLQTNYPNIFAAGDVAGPYQFTHTAAHMAWYAAVNALFGRFKKFSVDYRVIPWATFTDPEVARVGLNETEAKAKGIAYEVTRYGIDDLDRAIADGSAHGFVKVLTVPGKDKILGVTIMGEHAADVIAEFVSAMRHGLGLNKILGTIHIYPTLAESNKYAAGEWKRAHAPQGLLKWVEKFHARQLS